MSDSYDDVPRKIEWVGDLPSTDNPYREQLLVMTADRDAWKKYAQQLRNAIGRMENEVTDYPDEL
jgi:hypothetical protein